MEASTIFTGIAALLVVLTIIAIRHFFKIDKRMMVSHNSRVYWLIIFLILFMTIPRLFLTAVDPFSLIEKGLSLQNMVVVICALAVFSLALVLTIRKPVLQANLTRGASFWTMLLFSVYLLTGFWSVWPAATAFRSVELIGYYIVSLYIFTSRNLIRNLYFLILSILFSVVFLNIDSVVSNISSGQYYGFLRYNQFALPAAVFLFIHHYLFPGKIWGYLLGIILFIGFGSAAALAALLCGLLVYFIFSLPKTARIFAGYPALAGSVAIYFSMLFTPEYSFHATEWVASLLQKDVTSFFSASGRLDLWAIYLDDFKNIPLGAGFWAADRLHIDNLSISGLHFIATHAENGYLMSWTGAGFLGVLCLIGIYFSLILCLRRQNIQIQKFSYPLLLMLFLNSFTYPGIGGYFNAWYIILAALIALSGTESDEHSQTTQDKPSHQELIQPKLLSAVRWGRLNDL